MRIERRRLVKPTRFTEPEEAAERSLESISPVFVKAQSQNTAALIRFKAAHESEGESDITVKKKERVRFRSVQKNVLRYTHRCHQEIISFLIERSTS